MPPGALFDMSQLNFDQVVADREEIHRYNPQRFEMEQLTAIVHLDPDKNLIVGYKDVAADEFWVRGHMPGYPLHARRADVRGGGAALLVFTAHKAGCCRATSSASAAWRTCASAA